MSTAPPGPPRQITREAVATPTGHPAARGQPGPAERSGVTVNDRWFIRYRCVANALPSYEFQLILHAVTELAPDTQVIVCDQLHVPFRLTIGEMAPADGGQIR